MFQIYWKGFYSLLGKYPGKACPQPPKPATVFYSSFVPVRYMYACSTGETILLSSKDDGFWAVGWGHRMRVPIQLLFKDLWNTCFITNYVYTFWKVSCQKLVLPMKRMPPPAIFCVWRLSMHYVFMGRELKKWECISFSTELHLSHEIAYFPV